MNEVFPIKSQDEISFEAEYFSNDINNNKKFEKIVNTHMQFDSNTNYSFNPAIEFGHTSFEFGSHPI